MRRSKHKRRHAGRVIPRQAAGPHALRCRKTLTAATAVCTTLCQSICPVSLPLSESMLHGGFAGRRPASAQRRTRTVCMHACIRKRGANTRAAAQGEKRRRRRGAHRLDNVALHPETDFSATRRTRRLYAFLSVWYRWAASGLAGLAQLGSVSRERMAMRIEQTE